MFNYRVLLRGLGQYRWQLVVILLVGSVVNYLDRVNLSMAATEIRADFALTALDMGLLLSAFMWPYALANLPAGWLIDKVGWAKIFVISLFVWSVATIAGGLARNFTDLYVSRVVLGIAEAPFFIIGGKLAQLYFKANERGTAAGMLNIGPKIANGLAPPLLAGLIIVLSWRGMFISLGIVGLLLMLFWLHFYRAKGKKSESFAVKEQPAIGLRDFFKLFLKPTVFWFNIGNIGTSYVFWLYFTWLPTYLIDERHLSLKEAGWLTALPFIAGIIAVPVGGYLSDYLIKRGYNVIKSRLLPAVLGSLLAGLAIIPVNYVNDLLWAELLITISTFCVSARVGVLWALVGDIAPSSAVGALGGIQNFANFLGGTLAPLGTGWLLTRFGNNYDIVFVVSGAICIVGSLAYAMIRRPLDEVI